MNSSKANHFQEALTLEMAKGIEPLSLRSNVTTIRRVLICRPNHRLGNLLLITPLLQEITETFPECKIDLFVKGDLAPILFKNYENIDQIIQLPKRAFPNFARYVASWISIMKRQYDMVINVDKGSSSGRLSIQIANAKHKVSGDIIGKVRSQFKDYEHHAKFPIYNFRNFLTGLGFTLINRCMPSVDIKLTPSELAEGKKILMEMVQNDRKTICLFTYATGNKCYTEIWWENFYDKLQGRFPEANIIEVLPVQNVSKLSFKVPTFYSKDIREIGSVIANTDVFIGADSGIMHLANAVQTPTVGLFSVTNQNLYAPYNNNSVAINTNLTNTDECLQVIDDIFHYKFIDRHDLKIIA
jgi:ADP-heptose:LPS heptosyltransferase